MVLDTILITDTCYFMGCTVYGLCNERDTSVRERSWAGLCSGFVHYFSVLLERCCSPAKSQVGE